MKKCLVSGIGGLIGSSLVNLLLEDYFVYGVSREKSAFEERANFEPLQIDFSSDWKVSDLPQDIDIVIHLAQSEHFREFPEKAFDIFNVNTYTTLKLLDFSRKQNISKFLYASSGGIYGNSNIGFVEEDEIPLTDLGFYLGTKQCSEILVENYKNFFDFLILRFFFVYGEEQKKGMLIPRLLNAVKEGNPIILQGENGISINPIYVEDAARGIKNAITLKGSHKINIGGPQIYTLKEIAEMMGEKLGKSPLFEYQEEKQKKNLIGDIGKMEKILGKPTITLEQGIDRLIEKS